MILSCTLTCSHRVYAHALYKYKYKRPVALPVHHTQRHSNDCFVQHTQLLQKTGARQSSSLSSSFSLQEWGDPCRLTPAQHFLSIMLNRQRKQVLLIDHINDYEILSELFLSKYLQLVFFPLSHYVNTDLPSFLFQCMSCWWLVTKLQDQ